MPTKPTDAIAAKKALTPPYLPEFFWRLIASSGEICALIVPSKGQYLSPERLSDGKENSMQYGSLIRTARRNGPDVWEYRWREPGADGKRTHRRIVVGSIEQIH